MRLMWKPVLTMISTLSLLAKKSDEFIAWYNDNAAYPDYSVPLSILNWPGNGINGDYQFLAPYYDANDDGEYDPADGDYPRYDIDGNLDCNDDDLIYGDQTLYWVFNDKGNIHSETSADPIGIEVRAQAFAFATNDEINDMTFYNYKIINRATTQLKDAYFGQWVDPDLGNYLDDYVGCDVARGFGYCYNGDDEDEGGKWLVASISPAIGVDFFKAPRRILTMVLTMIEIVLSMSLVSKPLCHALCITITILRSWVIQKMDNTFTTIYGVVGKMD